ncbi:MAG: hypothetical protein Q9174_003776 [Haloplaca sp. 1 TL-2023]
MTSEEIPYWRANVPKDRWPSECPEFLLDLSERDQMLVGKLDEDYHRLTWPEVREVIEDNQLDRFVRVPSDLRRYLEYNARLKKEHGSVMDFVVKERLKWTDLNPTGTAPFKDPETSDIKILYNDWPYGIDERIVHLVVWTKFELPDDPNTKDLAAEMRQEIDDYVDRTFCQAVPKENVIWFKNWKGLKSIHSVEHFHVMMFDPDPAFIEEVTKGDLPVSRQMITSEIFCSRVDNKAFVKRARRDNGFSKSRLKLQLHQSLAVWDERKSALLRTSGMHTWKPRLQFQVFAFPLNHFQDAPRTCSRPSADVTERYSADLYEYFTYNGGNGTEESRVEQAGGEDETVVEPDQGNVLTHIISQLRPGADLSRVVLPTFILEPRSMLERITNFMAHPELLLPMPEVQDPVQRFLAVVKFYLSGWHIKPPGVKKPMNPILGETFTGYWDYSDGTRGYYISEQTCHHPPKSSYFYMAPDHGIRIDGALKPRSRFLGNSAASMMEGVAVLRFMNIGKSRGGEK